MTTSDSVLQQLASIRTEYLRAGLDERDVAPSPIDQLARWVDDAVRAGHPEPTAMTLATATPDGDPSARVVLLKGIETGGLVFFTSYESDKGRELAANPRACAVFFWALLERQVRAHGAVTKIGRDESEAYFRTRPRASQVGAWASRQSAVIGGRDELEARLAAEAARLGEGDVPCPPSWGGYRVAIDRLELWQGRPSRLHDRLRYTRISDASWTIERLSP